MLGTSKCRNQGPDQDTAGKDVVVLYATDSDSIPSILPIWSPEIGLE